MNIQNYINGGFHNPIQDNWIDNYDPSNGEVYGQIPNSSKEDVITVAGAVLGGTIGHNRAGRYGNNDGYYVTEDVCTTEYEYREHERINGYRVSYQYGDSIYETRTDRDPGATIAVRVNLQPLR